MKSPNPTINLFYALRDSILDYDIEKNIDNQPFKMDYSTKITVEINSDHFNAIKGDLMCLDENVDMLNVKYGGFVYSFINYEDKQEGGNQ